MATNDCCWKREKTTNFHAKTLQTMPTEDECIDSNSSSVREKGKGAPTKSSEGKKSDKSCFALTTAKRYQVGISSPPVRLLL